jgi:hypothetical protein
MKINIKQIDTGNNAGNELEKTNVKIVNYFSVLSQSVTSIY